MADKRSPVKQTDMPALPLKEAIRIPQALSDHYGKAPTAPAGVAAALDMSVNGGTFRQLAGAAAAYEIVEGGAFAEQISLAPLGRRIIAPTEEGDDLKARREALQKPSIMRDF
ncbi:MAG TPA: hypothetical protein VI893_10185, partial [Thermoplasmata archaeon]|nr:hypothetical protein [Thermoplasmata archaeon]